MKSTQPAKSRVCEENTLTSSSRSNRVSITMPGAYDLILALQTKAESHCKRVTELREEISSLRPVYFDVLTKWKGLWNELERERANIEITRGTLGDGHDLLDMDDPSFNLDQEGWVDAGVLRKRLSLWEAIEQLLSVTQEAKVLDIQQTLEQMYFPKVSRQALESAIDTHPSVFHTEKRGRERYVSLRHNQNPKTERSLNAASTKPRQGAKVKTR